MNESTNQQVAATQPKTAKELFAREDVRQKFEQILGKNASAFMAAVLQIVASNKNLANAEPMSIYHSAAVAATLNLNINNNLGFAYIVPYNDRERGQIAQFQMGYKGFIQLAQRSGQFKSIYASAIYDGQVISEDPLNGYEFDFTKKSAVVVGYAAKFKLLNGYEATLYMTVEQLTQHGKKFSQTFKRGFGLWKDDFESMALKTVLKLLLSKYAPLSVDMQQAVIVDQGIINDVDATDVTYVDNEDGVEHDPAKIASGKERDRIIAHVESAKSLTSLREVVGQFAEDDKELSDLFNSRFAEIENAK